MSNFTDAFEQTISGRTVPYITGMGNHEHGAFDGVAANTDFHDYFDQLIIASTMSVDTDSGHPTDEAPESFTKTINGIRFVVLFDDAAHIRDDTEASGQSLSVTDHKTWFTARMAETDLPSIVITHQPIINFNANSTDKPNTTFTHQRPFSDPQTETGSVYILDEIDTNNRVQMCLSGHWHRGTNEGRRNGVFYHTGYGNCHIGGMDNSTDGMQFRDDIASDSYNGYNIGAYSIITVNAEAVKSKTAGRYDANIEIIGGGWSTRATKVKDRFLM